jgi:hypothetical protein
MPFIHHKDNHFPPSVHRFGVFGGQVAVLSGLSTDLAFLVDKLAKTGVCPRKWGVLVDKLAKTGVCPRKWGVFVDKLVGRTGNWG